MGRARRFVDEFPAVDRGLLFCGRPGLGKTHLAVALPEARGARPRIARHLLRHARSASADPSIVRPRVENHRIRARRRQCRRERRSAGARRHRRRASDRMGRGDAPPHRQHAVQRAVARRFSRRTIPSSRHRTPSTPKRSSNGSAFACIRACRRCPTSCTSRARTIAKSGPNPSAGTARASQPARKPDAQAPPQPQRTIADQGAIPQHGTGPGSEMAGRTGGVLDDFQGTRHKAQSLRPKAPVICDHQSNICNEPGSLRPHPLLFGHLQLLQLQSRPVRRRAEGAVRGRAAARDSTRTGRRRARRHDLLRRRHAVAARTRRRSPAIIEACRRAFDDVGRRRDHARGKS